MKLSIRRIGIGVLFAAAIPLGLGPVTIAGAGDAPAPKYFFWKVTGLKGTAYLFGTIHVDKPEFYPLPAVIENSFAHADVLVEEIDSGVGDLTPGTKELFVQQGTYAQGDTVSNHLSDMTRQHLATYLKRTGQSEAIIARMKPWVISTVVSALEMKSRGFDPAQGLDAHFRKEAERTHKPIKGLETAEFQLKLLSSFDDQLQDKLLFSSLVEAEKTNAMYDMLIKAWQSGNADELQELITKSVREYPELEPITKKIIDDRNGPMTKQIQELLRTPKTFFIAVGAGHLVGEQGIISQLRHQNLTVERL
jgi:uncharacterized protein YbaP (TraB family)